MAKKAATAALIPGPAPLDDNESVSVEKIENGYLTRHSSYGPDGYQERKVFSMDKPSVQIGPAAEKGPVASAFDAAVAYAKRAKGKG